MFGIVANGAGIEENDIGIEFVVGGSDEYALKLKEVVRKYGTLSEDGDSIVDGIGGSGRVIQKIDFVEEELFNDAGFKIQTKTAIDKDIDVIVNNVLYLTFVYVSSFYIQILSFHHPFSSFKFAHFYVFSNN